MTNIAYVQGSSNTDYNGFSTGYVSGMLQGILSASSATGISEVAIAGVMAKESHGYFVRNALSNGFEEDLDAYARSAMTPLSGGLELLLTRLAPRGLRGAWRTVNEIVLGDSRRSHADWAKGYAEFGSEYKTDRADEQVLNPVLIEVGPGDLQIAKAIGLVNKFAGLVPALNLSQYTSNYSLLVEHMMEPQHPVMASLYAAYLLEAEFWFQTKSGAYDGQWGALPQYYKDALLISFVNEGEAAWEAKKAQSGGSFWPLPSQYLGGGMDHLRNADLIASLVLKTGYTDGLESIGSFASLAKSDDSDGLAYRYALKDLRYVALPMLNHSNKNLDGSLDRYDRETGEGALTDAWIDDRSNFLNIMAAAGAFGGFGVRIPGLDNIEYEDKTRGIKTAATGQSPLSERHRIVFGSDGGDSVGGGNAADRLYGGKGDDEIKGGLGKDYIEGGDDNDTLKGEDQEDVIWGGGGKDDIDGGTSDDMLYGEKGNDTIKGGKGKDTIYGDAEDSENEKIEGDDKIEGGEDQDIIYGGRGDDTIKGDDGSDFIVGGHGDDEIEGGKDDDRIYGDLENSEDTEVEGADTIVGNDGHDALTGGAGDDEIYGDGKNAEDTSFEGNDRLDGGEGDDKLYGGDGYDTLFGGKGDDELRPNRGGSLLNGASGNDEYRIDKDAQSTTIQDEREGGRQLGSVYRGSDALSGGKRPGKSGFTWYSDDGAHVYQTFGDPDKGEVLLIIDNVIWVERFKNHDLGINLRDGEDPPEPPKPPKPPVDDDKPGGGKGRGSNWRDPLILDLGGDGIQTVGAEAGLRFDHDGDGMREGSGWADVGDGMLVFDRNSNTRLDTGAELFGDFTPVGGGLSSVNGFQALSQFDQDHDGKITAADAIWSQLKVWRYETDDLGNAMVFDPDLLGRLVSLDSLGITAIRLDSTITNVEQANGNVEARRGSFELSDGTTRTIAEYRLERDNSRAVAAERVAVSADILTLPELRGEGLLRDLSQAMAMDTTGRLRNLMEQVVGTSDPQARHAAFETLMYAWAGVENLDPNSRSTLIDSRKIVFLEKLYGQSFEYLVTSLEYEFPTQSSVPVRLLELWRTVSENNYASILLQGPLADFYSASKYSQDTQTGDITTLVAQFTNHLAADPAIAKQEISEFARALRGLDLMATPFYLALREQLLMRDAELQTYFDYGGYRVIDFNADPSLRFWSHRSGTGQSEIVLPPTGPVGDGGVNLGEGNDVGVGRDIDEWFLQENGNALIMARGGDDVIYAGDGDDILDGGDGEDWLYGEAGADVYIFRRGGGHDTIVGRGGSGRIFAGGGLTAEDLTYTRDWYDLVIGIRGSEDTLTLNGFYYDSIASVDEIWLSDGTRHDIAQLFSTEGDDIIYGSMEGDTIRGLGGNDTLVGRLGDDVIDGGAGDDVLLADGSVDAEGKPVGTYWGASGNDVYEFNPGDGHDTIIETTQWLSAPSNDTIRFRGISSGDVKVLHEKGDLVFTIAGSGQSIRVIRQFGQSDGIDAVVFDDGTTWDVNDLRRLSVIGSDANDILEGFSGSDTIIGAGGNDYIVDEGGDNLIDGGSGDDVINTGFMPGTDMVYGGDGNDVIYANWGEDTVDAGAGDDFIFGSSSANTYVFGYGKGNDVVQDSGDGSMLDRIQFTADVSVDDARFVVSGEDLLIRLEDSSGDSLRIKSYFKQWNSSSTPFKIEQFVFGNGTTVLSSVDVENRLVFEGTEGDDDISGRAGNEALSGFGGDDRLSGWTGSDTIDGGNGKDTLSGGEGNDSLFGGADADVLYGNDGDDTLAGGAGDDTLFGGRQPAKYLLDIGNDTYQFGRGDGNDLIIDQSDGNDVDVLRLTGLTASEVKLTRSESNLVVTIIDTGEGVTVQDWFSESYTGETAWRIEKIVFDGGIEFDAARIKTEVLLGTDGADALNGYESDDLIVGGKGDDRMQGGEGTDVYRFGAGAGHDVIVADYTSASDLIRFDASVSYGDVQVRRDGDDLKLILSDSDSVTVRGWFFREEWDYGIETVAFEDGTSWNAETLKALALLGTPGADVLIGYEGSQTIDGGAGDDRMEGGSGDDTYIFSRGYGHDVIDTNVRVDGQDRVFLAGLNFADVDFDDIAETGAVVVRIKDTGETLSIDGFLNGENQVNSLRFQDGTILSSNAIRGLLDLPPGGMVTGTVGDDTLTTSDLGEIVLALAGRDVVHAGGGDDKIYGEAGRDQLYGEEGNDELYGENGPDQLDGGAGDDRLEGGQGIDTLKGGEGNDDLFGQAGDDSLNGGDGDDRLSGGDGSDDLTGGGGDDVISLIYTGDAEDERGTGKDTLRWARGDGFDRIESPASRMREYPDFYQEARAQLQALASLPDSRIYVNDYWNIHENTEYDKFVDVPYSIREDLVEMASGITVAQARTQLNALTAWIDNADHTMVFGENIRPEDLRIQFSNQGEHDTDDWWNDEDGAQLAVGVGEEEGFYLVTEGNRDVEGGRRDAIAADLGIRRFVFADGTVLTLDELLALADGGVIGFQEGEENRDFLRGSVVSDEIRTKYGHSIDARDGDDLVIVEGRGAIVNAGSGDDVVKLGDGSDIVAGGRGDDEFESDWNDDQRGVDVYAYNRGDGHDRIDAGIEAAGVISFGAGIALADLRAHFNENGDLVLSFAGIPGDGIEITWNDPSEVDQGIYSGITRVQFVDQGGRIRIFDLAAAVQAVDAALRAASADSSVVLFATSQFELTGLVLPVGGDYAVAYAQTGNLFGEAHYADPSTPSNDDDLLIGTKNGELINGQDGDDLIGGSEGDDVLIGGDGDDLLDGGAGDDTIDGGRGDDIAIGGDGDDAYRFNRGDGLLTIQDFAHENEGNRLVFGPTITVEDLRLYANEDGYLEIRVGAQGDIVRLSSFDRYWVQGDHAVERYEFADGTVLNYAQLIALGFEFEGTSSPDVIEGTSGADRIQGKADDDVLFGGQGNDVIEGGSGNDVYIFERGDGHDRIADGYFGDSNTLRFGPGIALQDISVRSDGLGTVVLWIGSGEDSITLDMAVGAPQSYPFRYIVLDDGTQIDFASWIGSEDVEAAPLELVGTPFVDVLQGTDRSERFRGMESDDRLIGGGGDDVYVIDGEAGIDTIEDLAAPGALNRVEFGAGFFESDLRLAFDAEQGLLKLRFADRQGGVDLKGFDVSNPLGAHAIDRFTFTEDGMTLTYEELLERGFVIEGTGGADELVGTAIKDTVYAGAGNDFIVTGPGDDVVIGGEGNDTYIYGRGDGHLRIEDVADAQSPNRIKFGAGITVGDLVRNLRFKAPANGNPGEMMIVFGNTGDLITMTGFDPEDVEFSQHAIELFEFADGTVLNFRDVVRNTFVVEGDEFDNALRGTNLGDRLYGYGGYDELQAGEGDDVLTGGKGNDLLKGGIGIDAYVFNLGDGVDTIDDATAGAEANLLVFGDGIGPDDLSMSVSGGVLRIDVGSGGDQIRVLNFDQSNSSIGAVEFADGQVIPFMQLLNTAPAATRNLVNRSATEDVAVRFTLAAGVFVDPEGGAVALSARLANGYALPAWLSFDSQTRVFSGTPQNGDVGSLTVEVIGTDSYGASDSRTFTLNIANVNDAPVLRAELVAPPALEDEPFVYVLPVDAFKDVDRGDTLSYAALSADGSPLPAWLHFDATTRTFSGIPGDAAVGNYAVKITATDTQGAAANGIVNIIVGSSNDAPQVNGSIADQEVAEGQIFNFTLPENLFIDEDAGDTLTWEVIAEDGFPTPTWLSYDPATRTFSGMPADTDLGVYRLTLLAFDRQGEGVSTSMQITVLEGNEPPVLNVPITDQSTNEDALFNFTFAANTFIDADAGDTLNYFATLADGSNLPSWLSFNAQTRTFSGTPDNSQVGTLSVLVTAKDGDGEQATDNFDIVVANTNDAPTVAHEVVDRLTAEDAAFSFVVPIETFADIDAGDALTYSAIRSNGSSLPGWLSFDAATRTFSGTPRNAQVGSLSVSVTAKDRAGVSVSETFNIVVENTNDAPTVSVAIADQMATEDAPFSYSVPAGAFADVDVGDVLRYSATLADGSALGWLSFDAATRTFSGTPLNEHVGVWNVRVTATDRADVSVSDVFAVQVRNVNDAPMVSNPIADQSASTGRAFEFLVPTNAFSDVDVGDTLGYTATLADGSALPGWLSFNPVTRTFVGTPTAVGTLSVKVTASDVALAKASDTFVITIGSGEIRGTADEDILVGTAQADFIYGLGEEDVLRGLGGDDYLDGGADGDEMYGGTGNDTFIVGAGGDDEDEVFENLNEGIDTVESSRTYALGNHVENLKLTGTGSINGTGNALDNVILGNSGANKLDGGAGNDRLDGGAGKDALTGGAGDDFFIVDRTDDSVIEVGNGGFDVIQTSVTLSTLANNVEGLILGGTGNLNGTGNTLANWIKGNGGANSLNGGGDNDVLEGGEGNDSLNDTSGKGLFLGGAGNDSLTGGTGVEVFVGGTGNDTLTMSTGADLILFNKGDGLDAVNGGTGTDNVLSLGGGIRYDELKFRKSSNDLVLEAGADTLTFKNWYVTSANNKSVSKLQMILEASSDYAPGGGNAIRDNKVEQFNFAGLVAAFDQARAANSNITSWALAGALTTQYLSGSDTAALGGDLAYYYGKNGTLAGMNIVAAQDVINASTLGTANQTIRPLSGISGGGNTLS